MGLFASEDPRRRAAVEAQDAIRRKYGSRALTRARLVGDDLAEPGGRDPMQPLQQRRVGRARPEGDEDAPEAPGSGDLDEGSRG